MAKPTQESAVKRDLRTPKYQMRVVEANKKSKQLQQELEDDWAEIEEAALCNHGYLAGCPYCKSEGSN